MAAPSKAVKGVQNVQKKEAVISEFILNRL